MLSTPTWYDAVNSEYFYEQEQIHNLKNQNNYQLSANQEHLPIQNENPTVYSSGFDDSCIPFPSSEFSIENPAAFYPMPTNESNQLQNLNYSNGFSNSDTSLDMQIVNDENSVLPLPFPKVSHAPCQGPKPWNFAHCYGFYGEPACPLLNVTDMEDLL